MHAISLHAPLSGAKGKFCDVGPSRSKLRASFWSSPERLGSCRALDWQARRTASGFVSGTVFWAAFLMPAAARSPVYGPCRGPSFGATETLYFGNHNVGPNHLDYLSGLVCVPILATRFASRAGVPVSESLCGPQNWTNAQYEYMITVILNSMNI